MVLNHDYAKLDWLEIRFKPFFARSGYQPLEATAKIIAAINLLDIERARPIRFFPLGCHLGRYHQGNLVPEITLRVHVDDIENETGFIYATLTGDSADRYLDYFSKADFPDCTVSRCDVAYDFYGEFHEVRSALANFAIVRDIDSHVITSTTKGGECTTQYVGNRKYSPTYIRLYQKGIQMGSEPLWNRLEFEMRPKRISKEVSMALWEQVKARNWAAVIGLNKWAVDLAKKL